MDSISLSTQVYIWFKEVKEITNLSEIEVRENTEIFFWCRRNATKKNSQNWEKLQEFIDNENLNEENFLEFLRGKAKN